MNERILKRIAKNGHREAISCYFSLLNDLINEFDLSAEDSRLASTVRDDSEKAFAANLNDRRAISLSDDGEFQLMLNLEFWDELHHADPNLAPEPFKDDTSIEVVLYRIQFDKLKENLEDVKAKWLKSCQDHLPLRKTSIYRRHDIDEVYLLATDESVLNEYLNVALHENDPIKTIIERYKQRLRKKHLKDEQYKWELLGKFQGRPDTSADDFYEEFKSIDYSNLVYGVGRSASNHIAKDRPEEYRNCFKVLFDENKPLEERLKYFNEETLKIYRELVPEEKLSHHQDERTMSTFLTYYNPDRYTFYKNSYYKNFCRLLDVKSKRSGEKYSHYIKLIDDFIENYISADKELIQLVKNYLPADGYPDQNHKILAQDILFTQLEQGTNLKVSNSKDLPTSDQVKPMPDHPLNQILFGPPGTGKTYHTINRAIAIIDGIEEAEVSKRYESREKIKSRFQELILDERSNPSGQIGFITFHQSMSYEDFIEGIKPLLNDNQEVYYDVVPGLFRNICINASFDIAKLQKSNKTNEVLSFSASYDKFITKLEDELQKDSALSLTTKNSELIVEGISQNGNIILKPKGGNRKYTYTVSKQRLSKLNAEIADLDKVNNIDQKFREIIGGCFASSYWAVLNAIRNEPQTNVQIFNKGKYTLEEKLEAINSLELQDHTSSGAKPYVLIIDEINRGNVSQIFGELITLIEEDKRLGNKEALEVTLPYSKEKFGVPKNLYIIGTMNTADRSVEALDTALRRRFSFEEMPPRYSLADLQYAYAGSTAAIILEVINNRIEKLLDKDHSIGHSYFILNEDGLAEQKLMKSFYKNIIPLLQEYFFGDFSKIGLVLGTGFVRRKAWDSEHYTFADFDDDSADDYVAKEVFEIIDYRATPEVKLQLNRKNDISMTFEKAVRLLLKQDIG